MFDERMQKIVEYVDKVLFTRGVSVPSYWWQHRDLLFRMCYDSTEQRVWLSGEVLKEYFRDVWFLGRPDLTNEEREMAEELCEAINQWRFAIDEQKCQTIPASL